jgi:preprotein translocase subunit YajC
MRMSTARIVIIVFFFFFFYFLIVKKIKNIKGDQIRKRAIAD